MPRTSPEFLRGHDEMMTHLLPRPGHADWVSPNDTICMTDPTNQSILNYTTGPMLCVRRGSKLALRYQENGHVSLLGGTPGKNSSGKIFVYATACAHSDDRFLKIHKMWNIRGTGGDRRGRLLVVAPFDDGKCYQAPSVPNQVFQSRRAKYPPDPGEGENRWCRVHVEIPSDPDVSVWTLYWVWDWSTYPALGAVGKQQIYTTCMDVCILD